MLSILIPVYNYDVRPLVKNLHQQAIKLNLDFEIFCLDDHSDLEYQKLNRELAQLSQIRYEELPQNIGRAAIRNRLAEQARFEWLLFMDCDTMPEQEDYLQRYVQHLKGLQVLYGGRSYQPQPPAAAYLFHWKYGSSREVSSASTRAASPYQSFMTNNFVIPKSLLLEIRFDEQLKQYGHEDTLFGLELKKRQIPILHLDNPMRHIGLEEAPSFLKKSEQAIQNLLLLRQQHDLTQEIKLLRYFEKTKTWGLHPLISWWFQLNQNRLRKRLMGKQPQLRSFDLYKLGYMVSLARSPRKKPQSP